MKDYRLSFNKVNTDAELFSVLKTHNLNKSEETINTKTKYVDQGTMTENIEYEDFKMDAKTMTQYNSACSEQKESARNNFWYKFIILINIIK